MTNSVRRSPGRPHNRPTEASRREILGAARHLFAEFGYSATTTREVAEAAGMQAGNLRHHFGSKAGLFAAVYDDCMGEIALSLSGLLNNTALSPGDYVRQLAALSEASPDLLAFMAIAPIERARHLELRAPLGVEPLAVEAVVRRTVSQWAQAGRVAESAHLDALADALIAAIYGIVIYSSQVDPTVDRQGIIEMFARLLDGQVWLTP